MALQQDDVRAKTAELETHDVQDRDELKEKLEPSTSKVTRRDENEDESSGSEEVELRDRRKKCPVKKLVKRSMPSSSSSSSSSGSSSESTPEEDKKDSTKICTHKYSMAIPEIKWPSSIPFLSVPVLPPRFSFYDANIAPFNEELKKVIQEQGHTPDWEKDKKICLKDQFIPPSILEEGRPGNDDYQKNILPTKNGLNLVKGKAAIGKTTLTQRLAKDWADGCWAQDKKAVFVLDVRALSTQDVHVDLTELLTQKVVYNVRIKPVQWREWLDIIAYASIIFLEGLDKICPHLACLLKETPHINNRDTKATPMHWIINLLRQDILPYACKIVTSRPCAGLSCIRFDRTFQLLGITHETAFEHIRKKDWTYEEEQRLRSLLDRTPYLMTTHYGIIFSSVFDFLTSRILPVEDDNTTITNRTASLVMVIASRHNDNEQFPAEILPPLTRLAQRSQPDHEKLVFDEQDLDHANINLDELAKIEESGLLISTKAGEDGKHCINLEFFDCSVQILLSVGSYLLGADSQHKDVFDEGHATQATKLAQRFLTGLTLDKTIGPITDFKTALGCKMATTLDKEVQVERLCREIAEASTIGNPERVIQLLQILFESQSSHLAKHLATILVQEQVLQINDTGLSSVIPELIFVMKSFEELRALKLTQAKIDDSCLSTLLSYCPWASITSINLDGNFITEMGVEQLANAIEKNTCLTYLSLSHNSIGPRGAASILQGLTKNSNLKTLNLDDTGLTDGTTPAIAECLRVNISLTTLSLNENDITLEGAEVILEALETNPYITVLSLKENQTDLGAQLISDTLRRNALSRLGLPEDAFSAQFTGENGGILQQQGSDVRLTIPPGAVPAGKTFNVYGTIHTNLAQFNSWMQSNEEYIAGPVPEYKLEGGERFEKPVEIRIPHCVGNDTSQIRVLFGTEQGFKDITNEDNMSFYIQDGFVYISTMHFTKFIVANTDKTQEIADALLTLAASFTKTERKRFIDLRLMLHSDCVGLNEFAANRTVFYDRGMEEIRRLKVTLPGGENPMEFPSIKIKLKLDSDWQARFKKKLVCKRDGKDVLFRPESSPRNRSEQLANFYLESVQEAQLSGLISFYFDYGNKKIYQQEMNVVYPNPTRTRDAENPRQLTGGLLSEERSEILTNTAPELMERVNLSALFWAILLKNKVLLRSEKEKIKLNGQNSAAEMIDLLIEHLQKGTNSKYVGFIDALVNTDQAHIASEVLHEDVSKYVYTQ